MAAFTAAGGRIRPRVVRVPPFLAIRVELRSRDGRDYALRFGSRTIAVGPARRVVDGRFPGLRPGRALVGEPVTGTRENVRVEAGGEPGP